PFAGRSLDLQPCRSLHSAGVCHHRTRTPEPKAPRGIASRSAKPVLFNDIDRWVLRCALVVGDPGRGGRPIRFLHRSCRRSARLERETPITSATVFIGNRPSAATAAAAVVFLTLCRVRGRL